LLNITEVDPIKYGLLFERFLNPKRITMPDIDVDIQDNRRDEVVKYIFDKYGFENTGLIITFQRLGAKSSLRDCARFLKLPLRDIDMIAKSIPVGMDLNEAYNTNNVFKARINESEVNKKLFAMAKNIEGLPRQVGTHAAGVVVATRKIETYVPTIKTQDGFNQTQFSMNYLENNGLLKIDILGLKNLTIIQKVQQQVFKNYQKKINLEKIKLNDEATNALLSSSNTNGVFQLESYGMKATLGKIIVNSIEDITAIISLYRPGPMEFIGIYAERKKGLAPIESISRDYDKILASTYGIIVYQEQIMEIAQQITGMSFSEADILRRAISKKNSRLIESLKDKFIKGGIAKGYGLEVVEKIYAKIEKFADYGFNKSHAVAYALIAYRMAFLKARFPLEFYTSLLNANNSSQDAIKKYVMEAKKSLIEIVPPNISNSEKEAINIKGKIILPFTIIKGFGKVANENVLLERAKAPFENFFDFVSRMKVSGLSNTGIEILINANVLREFGNMQTLLDSLPAAIRYGDMIKVKRDGIFVLEKDIISKPKLIELPANINYEITMEQKLFGFKLNAFPTVMFETGQTLVNFQKETSLEVPILIEKIFRKKDKNGDEMGSVIVSDRNASIQINIFKDE
jgi:DNA polymerase-3 subunit alpha